MTREEARASIKKHLDLMYPYNTPKDVLKVAYEALQQPQVVRCKDCRFHEDEGERDSVPMWLPCAEIGTDDDWFCGCGERKEGDGQ